MGHAKTLEQEKDHDIATNDLSPLGLLKDQLPPVPSFKQLDAFGQ
jgi:hypothetical protein